MTAKRFKSINCGLQGQYIKDDGIILTIDEIVELLNELHEERNYFERKKCEYWNEFNLAHLDNIQLRQENEQLKQFKDTTFVLINEMIETANLYRTPIKSLHYGDDLGYWNGVYQKLKELKEILFEKGDVE